MHPQKAIAQTRLQLGQGLVEQPGAVPAAQRHIFQLGLEVQHLGQRHAQHPAAVADHDHRPGLSGGRGEGNPLGHPQQRGLQAITAHRLGQVIDGIDLKRPQRVLAVRADKHHQRRVGQSAQFIGQPQAAAARHDDVEQGQVAGRGGQQPQGLVQTGSLGHHPGGRGRVGFDK